MITARDGWRNRSFWRFGVLFIHEERTVMIKRTLWYVNLALLLCGIGLVVMATSAGKTTLMPASMNRVQVEAATPTAPAAQLTSARPGDVKVETAAPVEVARRNVPPPSTTPDGEVGNDTGKETSAAATPVSRSQGTDRKSSISDADAAQEAADRADEAARSNEVRIADQIRKDREIQARLAGYDPNFVGSLSDEELVALLSGNRSSSHSMSAPAPEARPARTEADAKWAPVSSEARAEAETPLDAKTDEVYPLMVSKPLDDAAPVFEAQGEPMADRPAPLGETAEAEAADYRMTEADAYQRMMAGEPLTDAMKEMALSYEAQHPELGDRGRDALDNSSAYSGTYQFYDNVSPDTATYQWIELKGDPQATWVTGYNSADDGYSRKYPIGFSFPFYGTPQDSFRVCTNGFIQFTTTATTLTNADLPTSSVAGPAIFVYWDDLHLLRYRTDSLCILYRNFGSYTVVEFDSIGFYSSSCYPGYPLSFQAILYNDGSLRLQYREITAPSTCQNSATVGIQATGTGPALRYVYNTTGYTLANGRAITFTWRSPYNDDFATAQVLSPTVGPYAPSTSVQVTGRFFNVGATTQSTPVAYKLGAAGTVVTGNTNSLAQGQWHDFTFGTNATLRATDGTDTLWVYTDHPSDGYRGNDTLRVLVLVKDGASCLSPITIATAGPDSATYNNANAGDNSPGQPCVTTSYNDMIFKMSVPNDQQGEFWLTSGISNYHTLKWGGTCPGANLIHCVSTSQQKLRYVNHTGSAQDIWFTIGGSSSTSGNFKLAWQRQATSTYAAPFYAGFEITIAAPQNYTYHTLPNFWSIENTNADNYAWINYNSGALGGTYCAYKPASTTAGSDDWLFTPGLTLTNGVTYFFDYWRKGISTTYPESLEVKIGNSNTSAAMTQTLMPMDSFKTNIWVNKYTTFTVPAPGTYYIGFHSYTRNSSGGCYLDSVRVLEGACSAPTVIARDSSGTNFALLPSTATGGHGGPVQYHWFTGSGCQSGNAIPYATTASYLATSSGTYSLYAWRGDSALCGSCDDATATVTTECTANVPQYVENFDDVTQPALPVCWSQEDVNGDGTKWATVNTTPQSGTNCAYIVGTTAGNNDWLFSEPLALSSDTTYVVEYWRRNNSTTVSDCLQVKCGTQRLSGAMIYTIIPPDTCLSTTYVQKAGLFTPPATGTYYIGFQSLSKSSSAGTRVDSVHVYAYGLECAAPTVTVNPGVGQYGFLLTAVASGGHGGPLRYQWYTGTCDAATPIVGATGRTYLATASGTYSCRTWRGTDSLACGACDSGLVTLTCVTPSTLPLSEGFEGTSGSALPSCWIAVDVNNDGRPWVTSTSYPRPGGLRHAYNQYSTGTATNDWMFTKGVTLTGGDTVVAQYYYRCGIASSSYTESLELKAGSYPSPDSMTSIVDTNFIFSNVSTYTLRAPRWVVPSTGTYFFGWHAGYLINQGGVCVDDILIYVSGTCRGPDSVRVNAAAGADSVTLSAVVYGGYGGSPQYQWYTGVDCQTGNIIPGATSATYKTYVSGTFSCKVWYANADTCAACDSGYAAVIQCGVPAYAPLVEGFEAVTVPALPVCWTMQDFNAPDDDWMTTTSNPRTGTKCAYISYDGSLPLDDWMYTRGLQLSADTTYVLDFWYRAGSTSYAESLTVKYGRAATRDSMLYTLVPAMVFSQTTYVQRTETFRPPTTGQYHIGFRAHSRANQLSMYLDDITLYAQGGCTAPDSVRVNDATGADSVTLRATVYGGTGGAAQYRWYTGTNCNNINNLIVGATAESLRVYTTGYYSVKAFRFDSVNCYACDNAYANVINCAAGITPTYTENFDGVTAPALPACWTQENTNGDGVYWVTYNSASYARSAPNSARVSYNTSLAMNDWLFSPRMNLSSDSLYVLKFWYRAYSSSYVESLEVAIGPNPNSGAMTTLIEPTFYFSHLDYRQRVVSFIPPSTGAYYIGWHGKSGANQFAIHIDDVEIRAYPPGTCIAPDSVRALPGSGYIYAKLTGNVYGGVGGLPQYRWFTGLGCQAGNEIPGATSADYLALSSGVYSLYAWRGDSATCGACDSALATVIADSCGPVGTTPFTEGFESTTGTALPMCWTQQDLNYTTVYWRTTTTTPHSGSRCVYMYGYSGSGVADDWLYTPAMILNGGVQYQLGYWRRNSTTTIGDSLEIKFGTLPHNSFMTNVIQTADTNKTTTWRYYTRTFTPAVTDTYYIGFHCMSRHSSTSAYTYLDDIELYPSGTCLAPSLTVNDTSGIESATLVANASGGYGGALVYQWYTGSGCINANRIAGATSSTYLATSSGTYSCRVYRGDSVNCAACDDAVATVSPAPLGFGCSNPIYLSGSGSQTYNNTGMGDNSPGQSCGDSDDDMVFAIPLADGERLMIRQSPAISFDSRRTLRLGDCWTTTSEVILCQDDPDTNWFIYDNCGGYADTAYFIIGGYYIGQANSNFTLEWTITSVPAWPCSDISCTPTVTESEPNNSCGNDNLFNTITCGSVVSGQLWAKPWVRDVDGYELVLTDSTNITVSIDCEFDVMVQMRWDTAAASCPDVYVGDLNVLGTCLTETGTFYNVKAGVAHIVVYLPFTETCGPRDYCMTVTCAPGTPPPGESCTNPYTLVTAPNDTVTYTGTTAGFLMDYIDSCGTTRSSSPDVFYQFTLTECRRIAMKLTGGDMYLSVYESGMCGVRAFVCNDDVSAWSSVSAPWEVVAWRPTGTEAYVVGEMPAGTYLIRVGRYSTGSGTYTLKVADFGPCPCTITCQGGDIAEVAENRYDSTFHRIDPDGGCNSTPISFGSVSCSQTICGRAFTYQKLPQEDSYHTRDTDFYLFTITEPRIVTLTVVSEMPVIFGIVDTNNCVSPVLLLSDTADCTPTAVSDTLDPGTYAVQVAPVYLAGNPLPMEYRATLDCACLAWPTNNVTVTCMTVDGIGTNNDIRIRWTADSAFVNMGGAFNIYWHPNNVTYPGAGWNLLNPVPIPGVLGPHATYYDELNVIGPAATKRFYVVVGYCQ